MWFFGGVSAGPRRSLVERYGIVFYSDFQQIFTDFRQLVRARSRLYRSRFLQVTTRMKAFGEIYNIYRVLHLWAPIEKQ